MSVRLWYDAVLCRVLPWLWVRLGPGLETSVTEQRADQAAIRRRELLAVGKP